MTTTEGPPPLPASGSGFGSTFPEDAQPLVDAVRAGDVRFLQRAVVDMPILMARTGKALFGLAVSTGCREVVSFFASEIGVNAVLNDAGWTALHIAAFGGLIEVAKDLLSHGADTASLTKSGMTPAEVARRYGADREVLDLLRTSRAGPRMPPCPFFLDAGSLDHAVDSTEEEERRAWKSIMEKAWREQEANHLKQERNRVEPGSELTWAVLDSRDDVGSRDFGFRSTVPINQMGSPSLEHGNISSVPEDRSTSCGSETLVPPWSAGSADNWTRKMSTNTYRGHSPSSEAATTAGGDSPAPTEAIYERLTPHSWSRAGPSMGQSL